jgi:type IV pilus assembly protein PilA
VKKIKKGFTLLEILLVISAIGILAAIVLVAINPNRQLAQARDTVRQADINTLQKALDQYLIENRSYPSGVNSILRDICNTGSETSTNPITTCTNTVDLRVLVPTYLPSIPDDPTGDAYQVSINSRNNKISLFAPNSEITDTIAINLPPQAIGGTESVIQQGGHFYRVHSFTTVGSSNLTVTRDTNLEYLVVAGGGGGAGSLGNNGTSVNGGNGINSTITGTNIVNGRGGGVNSQSASGGSGGSGIVIIRYSISEDEYNSEL